MKTEECDLIGEEVLDAIVSERTYQRYKWGNREHTAGEWVLILDKLVGDARRAWVTQGGDVQAMHEIRQIAAVAVAAMEQCGSHKRVKKPLPSTIAERIYETKIKEE